MPMTGASSLPDVSLKQLALIAALRRLEEDWYRRCKIVDVAKGLHAHLQDASPQDVDYHLNVLESEGLVTNRQDPRDKRNVQYRLTDDGATVVDVVASWRAELEDSDHSGPEVVRA